MLPSSVLFTVDSLPFIMPLKPIKTNTLLLMNKDEILEDYKKTLAQQTESKITLFLLKSFCSIYLFSAALYRLPFVLLKDVLFHLWTHYYVIITSIAIFIEYFDTILRFWNFFAKLPYLVKIRNSNWNGLNNGMFSPLNSLVLTKN